MMLSIRFQLVNSFVIFSVLGLSLISTAASSDIPLEGVGIWPDIDACAQSCAISASSVFSSLASCPSSDPASCICNVAPAVSAVAGAAHRCASTSCTAFPSYSADPERARAALTSYCLSNGIVSTGTTVKPAIATSISPSDSSSTSQAPPSAQPSSITPQPSSSPSIVTSTSPTNPANPTTFQTTTNVQATTSSSASQSAPGWVYTTTGEAVITVAVALVAISIILSLCWIFRKSLRRRRLQLAMKLALVRRSESDGRNNNQWKERSSKEGEETEMGDLGLSGRRDREQGGQSAGRSRDETRLVERSDDGQGASGFNVARNDARSSLHPQLVHVFTKNGQTCDCHAKLDSGADDNFISISQLRKLGYDEEDLIPSQHTWSAFGDPKLSSLGSLELTWTTDNRTEPRQPVKFYVLNVTFKELVLGHDFSFKEGLLRYDRKAWTLTRNEAMSPEKRESLRQANEDQAGQSLAGRGIRWECEAATGWYFFRDAAGRKVYQNQAGGPTDGSGGSDAQGQNRGGSSR